MSAPGDTPPGDPVTSTGQEAVGGTTDCPRRTSNNIAEMHATDPSALCHAARFTQVRTRLAKAGFPLMLMLSLVQGLLWCWAKFGIIADPPQPARALTDIGKSLYRPDRDMPIYVIGTITCVGLYAVLASRVDKSRPPPAWSTETGYSTDTRIALGALIGVALLPRVIGYSPWSYLLACAAGIGVAAWRLSARRVSAFEPAPGVESVDHTASPASAPRAALTRRLASLALDSAVPFAVLAALMFVPWTRLLLGRAYAHDNFHHFDFYAMAPALAWAHGERLATDFFTQYGVGWPLVVAWLARATGKLNYTNFIQLEVVVGCTYFMVLFLFLRSWLRDAGWALAGMLLTLFVAFFMNNEEGIKWLWPSSTPMRYAFDVTFFAALLAHVRSGDARIGPVAGAVMALQLLFSSDVGIYMLLAFGTYVVCAMRRGRPAPSNASVLRFALGALLTLAVVACAGFTIANQGTLPDRAFWHGWSEALLAYGGGLTHLPIAGELGHSDIVDLTLPVMLVTYFLSAGSALSACLQRSVSQDHALTATIAVYGMGTLVLFIGRSHHYNLLHVAVPACLLAANAVHSVLHAARKRIVRAAAPHILSIAFGLLLLDESTATAYPNAINVALGIVQIKPVEPAWTRLSGDVVQPIFPRKTAPFRLASDAIRRASASGLRSVAVISIDDTPYLLEADLAPYFRYSPVLANLVFRDQVHALELRIAQAPPHWIFISNAPEPTLYDTTTADVLVDITAVVRQGYVLRGGAGPFDVYERARMPAAPTPLLSGP